MDIDKFIILYDEIENSDNYTKEWIYAQLNLVIEKYNKKFNKKLNIKFVAS